jgi:galactokinase/mevalonate kinase-like predicted kinase
MDNWLSREKRILLHAGGMSKRLPGYATSGKILTPIPVFRWERGQRLSQDLLSLQLPLYERIMEAAPESLHTMVVSGDVLIRAAQSLPEIPEADVVCFGLWLDASVAKNHGVFVMDRKTPQALKQMLQKPSVEKLSELQQQHYYLTDIGIWILSDKAVKALMKHEGYYDLYSDFGCALGTNPTICDAELNGLTVAILPLPGGEFYHFGTSRDLIGSTLRLQNLVCDQREIMHHDRKPHPSIFVQNARCEIPFTANNTNIWIENSHIGKHWNLSHDNVVTGVPENDWDITLEPGECIDVVPVGEKDYKVRRYKIDEPVNSLEMQEKANLNRLFAQREAFRNENFAAIARNWEHSVFYQLDLDDTARQFKEHGIPMPEALPEAAPLMTRIHDAMFRGDSESAFGLLREGLTQRILSQLQQPRLSVFHDQIVWGRSPVRIDIAGGWTDTPPYCLLEGGNVVNLAIELNGQPPLQVYVKPSKELRILLRSIDLGAREEIETWEQLSQYNKVGSPFSIPKAALALAGFLPQFSAERFVSLKQQLEVFGGGIELTLLSAIPAGSGLGTSSILAATVLGALNDFCGLGWDKNEIGHRTLILEQLLTTGGGWQDQFGGVLGGVKLLQTERGFDQSPLTRWLPTDLYTQPEYQQCHLLYYTGITRTAKQILAEIVRRMFLNQGDQLRLLR